MTNNNDPGHFFVANYGELKGRWAFVQNGKTSPAHLQGDKWDEFKRSDEYKNKMGKVDDIKMMSNEELLYHLAWDDIKAPFTREARRRFPRKNLKSP